MAVSISAELPLDCIASDRNTNSASGLVNRGAVRDCLERIVFVDQGYFMQASSSCMAASICLMASTRWPPKSWAA